VAGATDEPTQERSVSKRGRRTLAGFVLGLLMLYAAASALESLLDATTGWPAGVNEFIEEAVQFLGFLTLCWWAFRRHPDAPTTEDLATTTNPAATEDLPQ
jgi:hypothetical protein